MSSEQVFLTVQKPFLFCMMNFDLLYFMARNIVIPIYLGYRKMRQNLLSKAPFFCAKKPQWMHARSSSIYGSSSSSSSNQENAAGRANGSKMHKCPIEMFRENASVLQPPFCTNPPVAILRAAAECMQQLQTTLKILCRILFCNARARTLKVQNAPFLSLQPW